MKDSLSRTGAVCICSHIFQSSVTDTGYFPALTGGHLYKGGERKDLDIVMYEKRKEGALSGDFDQCLLHLAKLGFIFEKTIYQKDNPRFFVHKAQYKYNGNLHNIDFLFVNNMEIGDEYDVDEDIRKEVKAEKRFRREMNRRN